MDDNKLEYYEYLLVSMIKNYIESILSNIVYKQAVLESKLKVAIQELNEHQLYHGGKPMK